MIRWGGSTGSGAAQRGTGAEGDRRFLYDGDALVAEYSGTGTLLARYVHGPGIDEPLIWYDGAAVSNTIRRHLLADRTGSIVATTNSAGSLVTANRYDSWGAVEAGNIGRFQYTGQVWLGDVGLYYYKARMYAPGLGRFLQTDPIGYEDSVNLYAYVGNDPVNLVDPTGTRSLIDTILGFVPPVAALAPEATAATASGGLAATAGAVATGAGAAVAAGTGVSLGLSYVYASNFERTYVNRPSLRLPRPPEREIQVYRFYGGTAGARGPWWTTNPPESFENAIDVRNRLALSPEWGNTLERVATGRISVNNIAEMGLVGPEQSPSLGELSGGGTQVRVINPWRVRITNTRRTGF